MPDDEGGGASIGIPQLIACVIVGFVLFRWVFSSPQAPDNTSATRNTSSRASGTPAAPRRLRNGRPVTNDMIEVVQAMFPQASAAAIRYDLEKNGGSVETTTEKILEEGTLPEPPAGYISPTAPANLAPPRPSSSTPRRQPTPNTLSNTVQNTGGATASTSSGSKSIHPDLITRYNLQSRAKDFQVGSSSAEALASVTTKKNDKASLFLRGRERRDNMILDARKKMEERLAKEQSNAGSSSA